MADYIRLRMGGLEVEVPSAVSAEALTKVILALQAAHQTAGKPAQEPCEPLYLHAYFRVNR